MGRDQEELPEKSVLSLHQPLRFQLVGEMCQFEVFSTLFQAEERQWKSSQSTGSRSFELCSQVFPGTLLRLVLATSVVRRGTLSANCPQKMRRVSLTEGVIKYEGAGETRPRVRLQGNMGSIPQETSEFDDVRPEDSASQVGGQYLGTMSTVGGSVKKSLPPPPPPPPMGGSPKIARSRPGVPPQTMQPPKLPAKFSQDPPFLLEKLPHRADQM